MSPGRVVAIGAGVPFAIASLMSILMVFRYIPDDNNSKSLATIVIVGGGIAAIFIVAVSGLQKFEVFALAKVKEIRRQREN